MTAYSNGRPAVAAFLSVALGFFRLLAASPAPAAELPWQGLGPFGGAVVSLATDPADPMRLYAGGEGVFASSDAGQSWAAADVGKRLANPTFSRAPVPAMIQVGGATHDPRSSREILASR